MFDYPQLAAAVGAALGPRARLPGGRGWQRAFARAIVAVNNEPAAGGRAARLPLARPYRGMFGAKYSAGVVALPSASALVLLH